MPVLGRSGTPTKTYTSLKKSLPQRGNSCGKGSPVQTTSSGRSARMGNAGWEVQDK